MRDLGFAVLGLFITLVATGCTRSADTNEPSAAAPPAHNQPQPATPGKEQVDPANLIHVGMTVAEVRQATVSCPWFVDGPDKYLKGDDSPVQSYSVLIDRDLEKYDWHFQVQNGHVIKCHLIVNTLASDPNDFNK